MILFGLLKSSNIRPSHNHSWSNMQHKNKLLVVQVMQELFVCNMVSTDLHCFSHEWEKKKAVMKKKGI